MCVYISQEIDAHTLTLTPPACPVRAAWGVGQNLKTASLGEHTVGDSPPWTRIDSKRAFPAIWDNVLNSDNCLSMKIYGLRRSPEDLLSRFDPTPTPTPRKLHCDGPIVERRNHFLPLYLRGCLHRAQIL
jgi:hypothetical protein